MTPPVDPKSLTCDPTSIRWDLAGPYAPTSREAPRNVRPSSTFFNRGQNTWTLIARSKPALGGGNWACAIPMSAMTSSNSAPLRQGFCVRAKNMYGLPVIGIGYEFVLRSVVGSGGSGGYITRLEIAPTNVDVASGWNVDLMVVVQSPAEYGSPGALSAALPVMLQLNISTSIKTDQSNKSHVAFPQGVLIG
jgi:hypothetical protein